MANGTLPGAAQARDTLLDNTTRRIHSAAERVEAMTESMNGLADRIFGGRPMPVRDPQRVNPPPAAQSHVSRSNEAFDRLDAAVSANLDAQARLNDLA
jgi:hypothetical protein